MRSHRTYRCSAHLSVEDAPVGGGGAPRERLPVGRACGVACRNEKTPGPWAPGVKGGGWGIRTPEGLHPTRFPSVRHRPLGESSRRSTRPAATCNGQRIYPTPPGWRHSARPRPRWDRSRAPADERERVLPASWSRHRCQCERPEGRRVGRGGLRPACGRRRSSAAGTACQSEATGRGVVGYGVPRPLVRRHPANPPGPEGSKGKRALAGARGVLTCPEDCPRSPPARCRAASDAINPDCRSSPRAVLSASTGAGGACHWARTAPLGAPRSSRGDRRAAAHLDGGRSAAERRTRTTRVSRCGTARGS